MFKIFYMLVVIFSLASITGCSSVQPRSEINSNVSKSYSGDGKSVYIISHLQDAQPYFNELLKTSIERKFSKEGYTAQYDSLNGLELDSSRYISSAKAINASLIMVIRPAGGTVTQSGSYITAKYELKGFDLDLDKLVFKAAIKFHPYYDFWRGRRWDVTSSDKLASDIFYQLIDNHLIKYKLRNYRPKIPLIKQWK